MTAPTDSPRPSPSADGRAAHADRARRSGVARAGPLLTGLAALAVLAACTGSASTRPDAAGPSSPGSAPVDDRTGSPSRPRDATAVDTTTTETTTTGTAAEGTPARGARGYAVGVTETTFIDAARGRTLRVRLLYPALGAAPRTTAGSEVPLAPDAPPTQGAFPLVLFAHGYRLPADGYDRLLAATAAHGYVVAAPDFPGTSSRGGTGNRADLANQPADLSFVADQVVALGGPADGDPGTGTATTSTSAAPTSPAPIPAVAHPDRIAVAGHSDGGLTATAIAFNRAYRDPRVAAAASFTGGIGLFGGSYDAAAPPLLLVHGTADGTNPFSASVGARDSLPAPSWLVAVDGGDHIGPYMFGTGRPDLGDALAAFLDSALQGDPGGLDRLATVVADDPGLALVP